MMLMPELKALLVLLTAVSLLGITELRRSIMFRISQIAIFTAILRRHVTLIKCFLLYCILWSNKFRSVDN